MRRIKYKDSDRSYSDQSNLNVYDVDTDEYLGTIYLTSLQRGEKCVTHGIDNELIEMDQFTKPKNPNRDVWWFSKDFEIEFPIDQLRKEGIKFLLWEDAWLWLKRHSGNTGANGIRRKAERMALSISKQIDELVTFVQKHEEEAFYVGGGNMTYYEMEEHVDKYQHLSTRFARSLEEAVDENMRGLL